MKRNAATCMLLGGFAVALLLAGCGGGGGGSTVGEAPGVPPAGPVTVLTWDPPATFSDNEPVDPYRDIDHYEVYAREDANFANSDLPVMVIPAMTSVDSTRAPSTGAIKKGRKPNSEFILENLNPYISNVKRQYVSLKAVGVDGQKSAFMPPVAWDRT
ncbi:hypothetical protein [Candidatus Deferrimicrobium sp.]|uniref:hypothetical protein n=1 Tax=Candidatus Deferrimicrobium sp. TaxID=3060586 RepID=UPI002ED5C9C9